MIIALVRVLGIWIVIFMVIIVFFISIGVYLYSLIFERGSQSENSSSALKLKNYLSSKARRYNPKKYVGDVETKECCICFEEFGDGVTEKQLVELNCSNSHIFHLECLLKWIEKPENKSCPL